jgi:predicted RNA-binding protein Jag
MLKRKEVTRMTIKNKAKMILPAIAGVMVLAGVVTVVSAQPVNVQEAVDALTARLQSETAKVKTEVDARGEKVVTGDDAQRLAELHKEASNAKEAALARPAAERVAAIAKIRAFANNQGLNPEYVSTARSSYNHKVNAEFYQVGSDYYEVDTRTNQIVQFGPASLKPGEKAREYNTEAKFIPEQLEAKAREFIAKNAANADLSKLKASTGEKSGTNYFFRWTDESRVIDGDKPFIQVGFTVGGDLLSYTNSLGL